MPSVVIVDDSGVMRMLLRSIINQERYFNIVGESGSGAEVLEMTEALKPDVVCLDIMMPDVNGLEILRQLKSQHPKIAVVMITGSSSSADVKDALTNGADGYVLKPFNAGKVIDTLKGAYLKLREEQD